MMGAVLIGQQGRYSIESKIDEGGYGIVYKANAPGRKHVAIKILLDNENKDAHERMLREIQIGVSLRHENIISILDYGVESDGNAWFVMPFMAAGSLGKLLENSQNKFTLDQTLRLVCSLAAGLDAYHQQGGIHRDIKPENILIDDDGVPKLADFGVAQYPRLTHGNMTRSALGTPNYMAPEAARGKVCQHSDIYSLGIVLWELMHWKRNTEPFRPPAFEITLSQDVSDLYKSMINIDPLKRPSALMVMTRCRMLFEQLARVQPQSEPAKNDTSSPWAWLLGAAAGLVALGVATSNDWDGRSKRYRGSNGQFRSGRWG